ncbi:MAG: NADH-quinone oxidoreductase subunit C [Halothiobacillaceae bacterium]|jgi:NADH-quinone oxidoreductase subunit C|nr:NADH-quinone oxidoreductase subunit C [Halothiobacillaceae bacterium]MDY0050207.1 NADH-quinone oxidoreductase subunit C [Halothiobacillaceae bacterium]
MAKSLQNLKEAFEARFAGRYEAVRLAFDELTVELAPEQLLDVCSALCVEPGFSFEQLIDLCAVDYLDYGKSEWAGEDSVSRTGYSRGVQPSTAGRLKFGDDLPAHATRPRYVVVYHLLSCAHNLRLRLRVAARDDAFPSVPSVCGIWSGANWFEREAFDLYGVLFDGHPDLRRLLTDYGFVGHPFRKDFPLIGHVEVRYDPEQERVVYEPVSIEPRVLVPRVIREDNRYLRNGKKG